METPTSMNMPLAIHCAIVEHVDAPCATENSMHCESLWFHHRNSTYAYQTEIKLIDRIHGTEICMCDKKPLQSARINDINDMYVCRTLDFLN